MKAQNKNLLKIFIVFLVYYVAFDAVNVTLPYELNTKENGVKIFGVITGLTYVLRIGYYQFIGPRPSKHKVIVSTTFLLTGIAMIAAAFIQDFWFTIIMLGFILSLSSLICTSHNTQLVKDAPDGKVTQVFGMRDVFLYSASTIGALLAANWVSGDTMLLNAGIGVLLVITGLVVTQVEFTRPDNHTKQIKVDNPTQFYTYIALRVIMTFIFTFFGFLFFYTKERGLDVEQFAIILIVSNIASAALSLVGGKIVDKIGAWKGMILYVLALGSSVTLIAAPTTLVPTWLFWVGIGIWMINTMFQNSPTTMVAKYYKGNINNYWSLIGKYTLLASGIGFVVIPYIHADFIFPILISLSATAITLVLILRYKLFNEK